MNKYPNYRVEDDREHGSLYERCMGIIDRGIKRMGSAGSMPVSGHGRPRLNKKKNIRKKKD
jgi:hypothetical protein